MAAAHVFVVDLSAPALDDADRHHLQRVLRLRDGETVTAGDGRGSVVECRFAHGELEPADEPVFTPRPDPLRTIAFAPVKGERPEWAVQKLTELGVDRIVALRGDRSVVRWDQDRAAGHLERWRRVAREAAMQSRRAWLPTIAADVHTVSSFVEAAALGGGVVQADQGGGDLSRDVHTVLIGPEGGWSEAERGVLPVVSLGPHVLRTETAALAAAVRLCTFRPV